ISGIRWDENPSRAAEVFLSPREDPPHVRVHPILPWTERDVWTYTLEHDLPIHPLYDRGYRSFDGVQDSEPIEDRPAWEQNLEGSVERAGRAQDKEEMMRRLRDLGYF
ncbi:MAG: phosphoadenosine phosphosulfate reductase family protein, partial [Candidatus Geothermarchaeales archaeon]